jgi:ubiquinone/menaquinone biosynthesis C-methylase UbiE
VVVDVVITNGVFNLCVDKAKVVAEMFRVLRPGGLRPWSGRQPGRGRMLKTLVFFFK